MPVNNMLISLLFAASIDSSSRIEPPGCTIATTPFWLAYVTVSPNGKKPSEANTNPSSFPFSEFKLNGYTVGNEHSGKTVTITITFYAKQAEYVTWDELGTVNFTTGLAN